MKGNYLKVSNSKFLAALLLIEIFVGLLIFFAELWFENSQSYIISVVFGVAFVAMHSISICNKSIVVLAEINNKLLSSVLKKMPSIIHTLDFRLRLTRIVCMASLTVLICLGVVCLTSILLSSLYGFIFKTAIAVNFLTVCIIFYTDRKIGAFRFDVEDTIAEEARWKELLKGSEQINEAIKTFDSKDLHISEYAKTVEQTSQNGIYKP